MSLTSVVVSPLVVSLCGTNFWATLRYLDKAWRFLCRENAGQQNRPAHHKSEVKIRLKTNILIHWLRLVPHDWDWFWEWITVITPLRFALWRSIFSHVPMWYPRHERTVELIQIHQSCAKISPTRPNNHWGNHTEVSDISKISEFHRRRSMVGISSEPIWGGILEASHTKNALSPGSVFFTEFSIYTFLPSKKIRRPNGRHFFYTTF